MSAGTSEFFCVICLLVCSCTAQTNMEAENITAVLGKDVILPCKVSNNNILITAVDWIRPGLDPKYVLFYREEGLDQENQHPCYQNRVDLQDKDMKDGDNSMILKDVTKNDTGRYECWVYQRNKFEPISIIYLEVHDDSCKNSTIVGLAVGLAVSLAAVFILLILVIVLHVRTRRPERKRKTLGNREQEELELNADSDMMTLQNRLQEYRDTKESLLDENLKLMKTERKLKNKIHNLIQELEKQKWMKTFGNLKTELQNINQELKLTGPITVEEVTEWDRSIRLKNISSEEIKLGGWKLELQINNNKPADYTFNQSVKLPAGRILTMGHNSQLKPPKDDELDWPDLHWTPANKLQLKLISNNGETFTLL